jgi:hypothetical protein
MTVYQKILWFVDPLLGNDGHTNNLTMAVTRQRPVNNRRTEFSFSPRQSLGTLGKVSRIFIKKRPIFSPGRRLHKDYNGKGLVEK